MSLTLSLLPLSLLFSLFLSHSLLLSFSLSLSLPRFFVGFQVLVGFKDRVRLYNILSEKFKLYRETQQKHCKELKYSNGCQYWAGASAMVLVVYDSATFSQLMAFQGHMMVIRKIVWAPGDLVKNTFSKLLYVESLIIIKFCFVFLSLFPIFNFYLFFILFY